MIYLKDYNKPEFVFDSTELDIQLDFTAAEIIATHQVSKQSSETKSLELDCERMEIKSIQIDGIGLSAGQYELTDTGLAIYNVPDRFELVIHNTIDPSQNTALSGLYQSGNLLCTQCEAEGFRRITPALDRPDSLTIYTVKLTANKTRFPILLSNGNLIEHTKNNDDLHTTIWHDPFPKPTYLFAIVAGNLECLEDTFTTQSGRQVDLRFYARGKDIQKCYHAMESLKKSMTWDEQKYGREYDLDLFNVVAVEDFNMGAMENKSLNIFNTKYVLADTTMATDTDFDNVESVIGHEYFHNWSGNRVTCRDWFQLSLKEGFTVFRDQEFSADMGSRGVKRISDVNILRCHQFKEDASPMAHPVQPASYQEINNFYTVTIYNKGAEVVRMIHTLLGEQDFRKGTDLYFERHDGEAVTTDDFVKAMEDANGLELGQFKYWYSQAGTPEVTVSTEFDEARQKFILRTSQRCPETPDQSEKQPFVIPLKVAFFDRDGNKLKLADDKYEQVLKVDQAEQSFSFNAIPESPTISFLREFSAPIKLNNNQSKEDRIRLLEFDDDPFSKWEAGHSLFVDEIIRRYQLLADNKTGSPDDELARVIQTLLQSSDPDQAFLSQLLTLPAIAYLGELVSPIDPLLLYQSKQQLTRSIVSYCETDLISCIERCEHINTGAINFDQIGARSLRDTCLDLLSVFDNDSSRTIAYGLFHQPRCMTDESIAVSLICKSARDDKTQLLDTFYQRWKDEPLVIDKWLRAQATAPTADTLDTVNKLAKHPGFDYKNPNKVYALILGFTHGNPLCFHAKNGEGYAFLQEWLAILDPVNPQVAARLVSALNGWDKYTPELRDLMQTCLKNISETPDLSSDVKEIVSKNLAS